MPFWTKKPDDRLRLEEMMRLRKAYLPEPLTPEQARHLEDAKERCLACNAKALCDELLKAKAADGFSLFCPNCHYVEQVRSASLRFP
jgi:hypothetical protein